MWHCRQSALHLMGHLAGRPASQARQGEDPDAVASVVVGVPADLLRRRPRRPSPSALWPPPRVRLDRRRRFRSLSALSPSTATSQPFGRANLRTPFNPFGVQWRDRAVVPVGYFQLRPPSQQYRVSRRQVPRTGLGLSANSAERGAGRGERPGDVPEGTKALRERRRRSGGSRRDRREDRAWPSLRLAW